LNGLCKIVLMIAENNFIYVLIREIETHSNLTLFTIKGYDENQVKEIMLNKYILNIG